LRVFVAQLICPISYDDGQNIWINQQLAKAIQDHLPLTDVTWKNPASNSFVNISKLPLRFMPSSSSLFKDTNHPFRWFLAPYSHIYFIKAETIDLYKSLKPALRQWVDSFSGPKRYLSQCFSDKFITNP
jgi:hypothetical protein